MDEPLKSITGALSGIMRRSMNFGVSERLCTAGRARADLRERTTAAFVALRPRWSAVKSCKGEALVQKRRAPHEAARTGVSLRREDCFRPRTNARTQRVDVDAALVPISSGGDLP